MALAPSFRSEFRESLYRMITTLTGIGVTIFGTVGWMSLHRIPFSTYSISFLTDDIIQFRYVSIDGPLRRSSSFLTCAVATIATTSANMKSPEGVVVSDDRLTGYQGLITGIPVR